MASVTLEERVSQLERANEQLQRGLERAQDYVAVQNLASRYQYYHQPATMQKTFELFAKNTPGVSVAISAGVDEGLDRVKAFWTKPSSIPIQGVMLEHHLTTPVIEVAEDGQTAKGVWMSPGHETVPNLLPGGHWVWGRYAIDFVKENGQWKIWHIWFYPTFRTRFDRDWVEGPEPPSPNLTEHREKYPFSRPMPYMNLYTRDSVREMVPVPPDPYTTYEPYDPAGGAVGQTRGP